jgi:hypothetical protein
MSLVLPESGDPLFSQILRKRLLETDAATYLESEEAFEKQRLAILEQLRPLEDSTPCDIIEFIESDRYLNLKDFAFPAVYWVLDCFYNPHRHWDEYHRKWKGNTFTFPGFAQMGISREDFKQLAFQELVLFIGMRTAKSWMTGIIAKYEAYKAICKWPDPQTYYRERGTRIGKPELDIAISPGTQIYISTCATSATQAAETCGAAIMAFKDRAPWFQRYFQRCREIGEMPNGKPILQEYSDSYILNHKYLTVNSMHARTGGMVGRARLLSILDEIAKMDESGGARDAGLIYNNMTVGTETFQDEGKRVSLSSPTHLTDMINVLFARCKYRFSSHEYDGLFKPLEQVGEEYIEPVGNMLGFHFPTWELNPTRPKRVFEVRMRKDPVSTMRDFGALPAAARTPFIANSLKIRIAFDWNKQRREFESQYGDTAVRINDYTGAYELAEWLQFSDRYTYWLHFDAGLGRPSNFGIAVGHGEPVPFERLQKIKQAHGEDANASDDPEIFVTDYNVTHVLTKFDFMWHFAADPQLGEVDFEKVENFIVTQLVPRIPNLKITTDRWNSAQLIQRLKRMGGNVKNFLVKDEHYYTMKNQLDFELIDGYWYEQAYEECRRLEKDPVRGRVAKGPNFTKDVADCLAAVTACVVEQGVHKASAGRNLSVGGFASARTGGAGSRLSAGRTMGVGGFGGGRRR